MSTIHQNKSKTPINRAETSGDSFQRQPVSFVGRAAECSFIRAALHKVQATGTASCVFIQGPAGIGKSALVEACRLSMVADGGRFASGKYTSTTHAYPYSALRDALEQVAHQLLSTSGSEVYQWHRTLREEFAQHGQLLVTLVPAFKHLLGAQPGLSTVKPEIQPHRFFQMLDNLIRAIGTSDNPLVLFLDDLHWADVATFELIRHLLTSDVPLPCLLLCAYRPDEVDDGHSLTILVAESLRANTRCQVLRLSSLTQDAIAHLIAETLHYPVATVQAFANILATKANGNPFFVQMLLRELIVAHTIPVATSGDGVADGAIEIAISTLTTSAQALDPTANVLEWLVNTLQQQSLEMCTMLGQAACIDGAFDAPLLKQLCHQTLHDAIPVLLKQAEILGILQIQPRDEHVPSLFLSPSEQRIPAITPTYVFAHDVVQESAYGLLSKAQKQSTHWHLGQLLLSNAQTPVRGSLLYRIVEHLNHATSVIAPENTEVNDWDGKIAVSARASYRSELAALNLQAGRQAITELAPVEALTYLMNGMQLLGATSANNNDSPVGEQAWQNDHRLQLDLHLAVADATFMVDEPNNADAYLEDALQHCAEHLARAEIYLARIRHYTASHRFSEALTVAHIALAELGYALPPRPGHIRVSASYLYTRFVLARTALAQKTPLHHGVGADNQRILSILSPLTDPIRIAAMSIMHHAQMAAQWTGALNTQVLMALRLVRWSLQDGLGSGSAYSFAFFAVIQIRMDNIVEGIRWGQLSLQLPTTQATQGEQAQVILLHALFVAHWYQHLRDQLQPLRQAIQQSSAAGEVEAAANCALAFATCANMAGMNLTKLDHELATYYQLIAQSGQATTLQVYQLLRQAFHNMMTDTADPTLLQGEFQIEEDVVPLLHESHNVMGLATYHSMKAMLLVVFGEAPFQRQQALAHADQMWRYFEPLKGMLSYGSAHYVDTLARLARYSDADVSIAERRKLLTRILRNQRLLRHWAKAGPINHFHRARLVDAEVARLFGRHKQARAWYAEAINHAVTHEFHIEAGGMYEIAGRYYLAQRAYKEAGAHLEAARSAFAKGGMRAKVTQIMRIYQPLGPMANGVNQQNTPDQESTSIAVSQLAAHSVPVTSGVASTPAGQNLVDIQQTLLEASTAQELFDTITTSVRGLTGVDRVLLFVTEEKHPLLVAETSTAAHKNAAYPSSVTNFVVRTLEMVSVNAPSRTSPFEQDPYFSKHKPSILCLPLLYQQRMLGLLYLEIDGAGDTTNDPFSTERVSPLTFLATTAALLIENRRLRDRSLVTVRQEAPQSAGPSNKLGDADVTKEAVLHIHLLGNMQIQHAPNHEIALNRNMMLLVAYLLLHRGKACPRSKLANLLWPDSNEKQARTNLRNLLHNLTKQWPEVATYLEITRGALQWQTSPHIWLDVAIFSSALDEASQAPDDDLALAHLQRAVDHYRDNLLSPYFDP
ncbi:MAG: AAA family ATPase, partial [Caldilineaceae bacterium]|nr:AAA family ATPase [Caldilineaceae bacterium]